jgi:hypothetical protein
MPIEREPTPQEQKEGEKWFLDAYGIPFSFAQEMSKWKNSTGAHWKHVLEYLASGDDPLISTEPPSVTTEPHV